MSNSKVAKRQRHVPVRGASHVYKSQRSNGSWVYEVRHPRNGDGKRLFEVVGTRLDAAKARAREIHGEQSPRVGRVGMTLAEVYAAWVGAREVRLNSAASFDRMWKCHIEPVLGRRKVREIDSQAVLAWLSGLKRRDGRDGELASGSKRLALAVLKIILRHGVEIGALGAVPRLPLRRTPKRSEGRKGILSSDEERTLLAYCARTPWMRPIITVALHQALRLGEVLGLRWEDVDFVAGTVNVRHSLGRDGSLGQTKSGREEEIPLTPAAKEALLDLRLDAAEGFIFLNTLGGQRQLRDVQRAFDKARSRAGLDDVVFHSLRHTGISRLANHPGIPLVQVRDFARHTDLATTQGYVHRIDSEKVTAAFAEALTGGAQPKETTEGGV